MQQGPRASPPCLRLEHQCSGRRLLDLLYRCARIVLSHSVFFTPPPHPSAPSAPIRERNKKNQQTHTLASLQGWSTRIPRPLAATGQSACVRGRDIVSPPSWTRRVSIAVYSEVPLERFAALAQQRGGCLVVVGAAGAAAEHAHPVDLRSPWIECREEQLTLKGCVVSGRDAQLSGLPLLSCCGDRCRTCRWAVSARVGSRAIS